MTPASLHKSSKGKNKNWLPGEDDTIRRETRSGASATQIAALLENRSPKAVQNRALRLGLAISARLNLVARAKPQGIDGEIIRLCGYISSDSYIANYLGTNVERVKRLRQRTPVRSGELGRRRVNGELPPIDLTSETKSRAPAEHGSDRLRRAMLRHYARLAAELGISITDAARFCLSGRHAQPTSTTKGNANV